MAPVRAGSCFATPTHFCVHLVGDRDPAALLGRHRPRRRPAVDLHLTRLVEYTFRWSASPTPTPSSLDLRHRPRPPLRDRRARHAPGGALKFFVFTPGFDAPTRLWYQSASRSGVGGAIHIHHTSDPEPSSLLELLGCADGIGRALGCAAPRSRRRRARCTCGTRMAPAATRSAVTATATAAHWLPTVITRRSCPSLKSRRPCCDESTTSSAGAVLAAAMARTPSTTAPTAPHVERHPEHHRGMDRVGGGAPPKPMISTEGTNVRAAQPGPRTCARCSGRPSLASCTPPPSPRPRRAMRRCGRRRCVGSITTNRTRLGWVSKRSASLRRCG